MEKAQLLSIPVHLDSPLRRAQGQHANLGERRFRYFTYLASTTSFAVPEIRASASSALFSQSRFCYPCLTPTQDRRTIFEQFHAGQRLPARDFPFSRFHLCHCIAAAPMLLRHEMRFPKHKTRHGPRSEDGHPLRIGFDFLG